MLTQPADGQLVQAGWRGAGETALPQSEAAHGNAGLCKWKRTPELEITQ